MFTYKYPRPALTADAILLSVNSDGDSVVLLVKRGNEPFKGQWAFPGGFVNEGERAIEAARRELHEETGILIDSLDKFIPIGLYDTPGRDPRGWTVSAAFCSCVDVMPQPAAADDADNARWFLIKELPHLAFDHETILNDVIEVLANLPGDDGEGDDGGDYVL